MPREAREARTNFSLGRSREEKKVEEVRRFTPTALPPSITSKTDDDVRARELPEGGEREGGGRDGWIVVLRSSEPSLKVTGS